MFFFYFECTLRMETFQPYYYGGKPLRHTFLKVRPNFITEILIFNKNVSSSFFKSPLGLVPSKPPNFPHTPTAPFTALSSAQEKVGTFPARRRRSRNAKYSWLRNVRYECSAAADPLKHSLIKFLLKLCTEYRALIQHIKLHNICSRQCSLEKCSVFLK